MYWNIDLCLPLYHFGWLFRLSYGLQTLEMLVKKEQVLEKRAAAEVQKAKEFTKAKNKRGMFLES